MIGDFDKECLREFLADVLRILLGVVDLRRAFKCPDPDHDDGTPSAMYYKDNFTVHCFGCGKTWDVFSLVGTVLGIAGFPEQARKVAELVGYRLDEETPGGRPRPSTFDVKEAVIRPPFDKPRAAGAQSCYEACGIAFSNLYLPENGIGRQYLRDRGFDDYDIGRFGLGFVRNPQFMMHQFRYFEPEAEGFIVIPFYDEGFVEANYCVARTISRGTVQRKEWRPKGVASPLYNEWMLSAALHCVYVTEGPFDAMALTKLIGKHVMALAGTGGANRLAQILYHEDPALRPEKIIVCMDEDEAGRKAADKICADLSRIGIPHGKLDPYPGGAKDANEVLVAGRGVEWDYEPSGTVVNGLVLYTRRWRDDG